MKKLFGMVMLVASMTFIGASANAATGGAAAAQRRRVQVVQRPNRMRRWNNRRAHVVTQTRIVQRGRWRYRETYEVIYRPNGMTQTRLISRVRV